MTQHCLDREKKTPPLQSDLASKKKMIIIHSLSEAEIANKSRHEGYWAEAEGYVADATSNQ